ncbi:MAG: hypothetical protein WC656_03265 [Sulfurimonas sp.]|jgi:hypothetical protein
MRIRKKWSSTDLLFLRKNYQEMGARLIGFHLGRNRHDIIKKAHELGINMTIKEYLIQFNLKAGEKNDK